MRGITVAQDEVMALQIFDAEIAYGIRQDWILAVFVCVNGYR